jgi:hypothetical protein
MEGNRRRLGSRGSINKLLSFPGAEAVELPWIRYSEPAQAADLK